MKKSTFSERQTVKALKEVERTFAWWNWCRRIIKDYERTIENSAGFDLMANMQMVLSSLAKLDHGNF